MPHGPNGRWNDSKDCSKSRYHMWAVALIASANEEWTSISIYSNKETRHSTGVVFVPLWMISRKIAEAIFLHREGALRLSVFVNQRIWPRFPPREELTRQPSKEALALTVHRRRIDAREVEVAVLGNGSEHLWIVKQSRAYVTTAINNTTALQIPAAGGSLQKFVLWHFSAWTGSNLLLCFFLTKRSVYQQKWVQACIQKTLGSAMGISRKRFSRKNC